MKNTGLRIKLSGSNQAPSSTSSRQTKRPKKNLPTSLEATSLPDISSGMDITPEESTRALEQIKLNTESAIRGGDMPVPMEGLKHPIDDPTIPNSSDASELAEAITGKIPSFEEEDIMPRSRSQSKSDVKKLINKVSAELGITVEVAHLDDLYHISSERGELEEFQVWLYLRGVMRTNQISATTTLVKLTTSLSAALDKSQHSFSINAETNRLTNERLSMLGQKVEAITPAVNALVRSEHALTREFCKGLTKSVKVSPVGFATQASKSGTGQAVPGTRAPNPSASDIAVMCQAAGVAAEKIPKLAEICNGVATWEEYDKIMKGKLAAGEGKAIIASWRSKVAK